MQRQFLLTFKPARSELGQKILVVQYHQVGHTLTKAPNPPQECIASVAVGNSNGLKYAEKSDQETAEGCNQFIMKSTKSWNYLYLMLKAYPFCSDAISILWSWIFFTTFCCNTEISEQNE